MIIGISGKIGSGKDTVGKIIQYLIWNNGILTVKDIEILDSSGQVKFNAKIQTGWEIKKLADILKDIVCLLIGCTREQLEDAGFKNKELGEEWWKYKVHDGSVFRIVTKEYYNSTHKQKFIEKPTPRLLLQLLGTECGRNIIHPNVWVNSLFNKYKFEGCKNTGDSCETASGDCNSKHCYPNFIITDTRFENELKAVKDRGGISIRVNRDNCICDFKEAAYCDKKCRIDRNYKEHPSETALDNAKFDYVIDNNSDIQSLIEKVKEILIKEKLL